MAECISPGVEAEDFAFQRSSPLSLRQPSTFSSPPAPALRDSGIHTYNYESTYDVEKRPSRPSESITRDHDLSEPSDDRRVSGHSSISSFPASVLHHDAQRTPSRPTQHVRHDSFSKTPSPRRQRGLASGFRNPSSILDMQLNDDTGDDAESIMSNYRRSGSRMSVRSHGSNQSSPSKRGSRSLHSSPKKSSGLRKEFPLVLLHCTLLPPSNNWLAPTCDDDLFAALLPDGYRQRWIQLQDKLSSAEVKLRGILLPHPQEDYELLEERLLEALELETPRIQGSHFDDKGTDSGFESGSQTESDGGGDDKCPDCGRHLSQERKWEIKVFAANGLMRGAAWTAAWRDMEKVDVEIGLWMPEEVRREVNTRLEALRAAEQEAQMEEQEAEAASATERDVHQHGVYDDRYQTSQDAQSHSQQAQSTGEPAHGSSRTQESALQPLLQDRRNIAILLLSLVVAVYAIFAATPWTTKGTIPLSLYNQILNTEVITSTEIWTTTVVAHATPSTATASANASLYETSRPSLSTAEPSPARESSSSSSSSRQDSARIATPVEQGVDTESTDPSFVPEPVQMAAPTLQHETSIRPDREETPLVQVFLEDGVSS